MITQIFERVQWVKGALAVNEVDPNTHSVKTHVVDTLLTDENLGSGSCGGVCAVGAIMSDLGATMVNYSDERPVQNFYGTWSYSTDKEKDFFVVFGENLRRYGVDVSQKFFKEYLVAVDWYELAQSRTDRYIGRFESIEGWNDSGFATEEDVRNFLDVLDTFPAYRMVSGLLTESDSNELREIHAQCLRLEPLFDTYYYGSQMKIFNQVFGLDVYEN